MSPLISAPNRGYADYQRTGNWDTGVLFTFNVANVTSSENSPLIDVSRFAYLSGFLACNAGICSVDLRWWSDTALSALLGARFFRMTGANGAVAQLRVPNLGPFITIQINPIVGTSYTADGWFTATNRVNPIELVPQNPVVVNQQGVALGAGATAVLYPTDYYAGPMNIWFSPSFVTSTLSLRVLNAAGAWDFTNQIQLGSATNLFQTWLVPLGAWRMEVFNSSAAANVYWLTAAPSTSGAT